MVVALAQKVVNNEVPDYLKDCRLIEVDLARMAAGTSSPAEFQERFIPLCKGIAERYYDPENPRIIIFSTKFTRLCPIVKARLTKVCPMS